MIQENVKFIIFFFSQTQLLRSRADGAVGRRHLSDRVGLHHVRRVYVHDARERRWRRWRRWRRRRRQGRWRPASDPRRAAAATAPSAGRAAATADAGPGAGARARAAAAAAAPVAVSAGAKRQAARADGREAVEDH